MPSPNKCRFCGEKARDGLCVNCGGLVEHVQHKMRYRETAKLRTGGDGRTDEQAEGILTFAAQQLGLGVSFESGDGFVRANTNGEAISVPREPTKRVAGYAIDDIDPIRIELELETTRQRVNLFSQLAAVDDEFTGRLLDEMERLDELQEIVGELARERAEKRAASNAG